MHTDIMKELLAEQSNVYKRVSNGDYSEVCYREEKDDKFGIYDKNYIGRLRLVYYILFENLDNEDIIKRLFEEELMDRQTDSFQGIGHSLEILTSLLRKYNSNNRYDGLFDLAKNANFDCACGYDRNITIPSDLNEYDIYDCIEIATSTKYTDYAKKLINRWKESITDWDERNYRNLIYFNKASDNEAENEELLKILLGIKIGSGKNLDIISQWRDLIHYYIQYDKYEQAYQNFIAMINSTKLSEVYPINLFNFILEDCVDLICKYGEQAESLWDWAKPFLKKKSDDMYGNLYEKSIKAAETVNDGLAKILSKKYALWRKRISL